MRTKPSRSSTRSSTRETTSSLGLALYIHIPFCASKCRYCDFNSFPLRGRDKASYLEALLREIRARAPLRPATIYIGGGTPSILDPEEVALFLSGLDEATGFRGATQEVSFECNPESLTLEKARLLAALGVTRLSIGVQSFEPRYLAFYGRAHNAEQARKAYAAAREAGFQNVNLDLIFCAPGQTLEEWAADLEKAIHLGPDHISAFDLLYEEGTTLLKWKLAGRVQPNEEESQAAMYRFTMERLAAAGYERYEISSYARDAKRCLHNINYWKNGEYVGVGAGAVSYVEGRRFKNPSPVEGYIQAIIEGGERWEEEERLSPRERLGETMMLRLRLAEGVDCEEVRERTGMDPREACSAGIASLETEGLLRLEADRIRLTDRGLLLADLVAARFL